MKPCIVLFLLSALLWTAYVSRSASLGSPEPSGPRGIRFLEPVVDLGRVPSDRERTVGLRWARTGSGPLRVFDVQTDCGCAVTRPLPDVLAARAHGTLRVRLSTHRRDGPLRVRVRVITDGDPPHDVADAHLVGYVRRPFRLRPDALQLGARTPGSTVERRIEVTWLAGSSPVTPVVRLAGLRGRVAVEPPAIRRNGRDLLVRLRVPERTGPFAGVLEVDLGRLGTQAVPIRGEVPLVVGR